MSTYFSKRFQKQLLHEEELPMRDVGPEEGEGTPEADAFGDTLDSGTDPDQFNDIEGAAGALQGVQDAENQSQIQTITEWIEKVEEFTSWLNGLEGGSIQQQLKDSPCDTLLDNVSKSETKKITRIAQELSALKEALKGYILSSDDQSPSPGANLARQGPQVSQ